MAKNACTKFFLRTKAASGNAFLYTRRQSDGEKLLLKSVVEVDIKQWSDAVSTTSKWNKFRSGEGKYLCDKLDEITVTIDLVLSQPNPTKKKLDKAIVSVAQREQIQEQAVLKKAQEEAQERKRAQREAEQRRKKEELEAMLRQREESFIVALDVFIDAAPARTWHGKPIGLKTIQHY